jgi:flagellar FliL protein
MSEEPKEGKKKKGKLPIILVLALLIGGGGFFMMKSKGKAPKEPEIKLGTIEPLTEFLVNLKGGSSYLQTEMAFQLKDGYKKEEFDKNMPAIRDAVLSVLSDKSVPEVSTEAAKAKLKREIAAAVNKTLEALEPPKEEPEKKKKKKKKDEEEVDPKKAAEVDPAELEHPEWDSEEGPILKVYFTKFATQ